MIIKYSRKFQWKILITGIIFLVLGLIAVWIDSLNPVRYLPMMYGISLLVYYHLFLKKTPYLQVEGYVLTIWKSFKKKKINLSEVIRIKKFAGDITLFTSEIKIKIRQDVIDEASMEDLDKLLSSLDAEAEEYPCKKISFNNS